MRRLGSCKGLFPEKRRSSIMEPTQKLSDYLGQGSQDFDLTAPPSFNAFITLFAVNLVHRYPGPIDLNSIDVPGIQSIAKLSAVCSSVATEVWNDTFQKRTRGISRTRAA